MKRSSDTLKAANIKWLVMLAMLDVAVVLFFVAPELVSASAMALLRASSTAVLPVVVLLLTGLLSHDIKATLVFWRIDHPLPGSRAFSKYGPADTRIDMKALAKHVGALPTDPAEQNAKWYKLYKMVGDDAAVAYAHKLYLMYRDMATMSLLLIPVVPIALWSAGAPPASRWLAGSLFALQYVLCAISARHSGTRFVCNVLSLHSIIKFTAVARPKSAPDASTNGKRIKETIS